MEQTYRYRGFDLVVKVQREAGASGDAPDDAQRCAFVVGVTLKTGLVAGEWSTEFRVAPADGGHLGILGSWSVPVLLLVRNLSMT